MKRITFTEGDRLLQGFFHRQANDGTIFHVRSCENPTIHVQFSGNKITATHAWQGDIKSYACFGGSLYFFADKIYKATFVPPEGIQIDAIRELEPEEKRESNMLLSRMRDGKKVIYRACDAPNDGIEIDAADDDLKDYYPLAIHRGKLVFLKYANEVSARAISKNIIGISILGTPMEKAIYANDDSAFIYLCTTWTLFMLEVSTMQLFSTKHRNGQKLCLEYVIGVHDGTITVKAYSRGEFRLYAAPIPNIQDMKEVLAVDKKRRREDVDLAEEIEKQTK
ncbi:hypothetical protein PFISCL1PPCAC_17429, partial [Pristionchus fissidentatus]